MMFVFIDIFSSETLIKLCVFFVPSRKRKKYENGNKKTITNARQQCIDRQVVQSKRSDMKDWTFVKQ